MNSPVFFRAACHPSLAEIVAWTGAAPAEDADLERRIDRIAPLDLAVPGALTFLDNPRYAAALSATSATACLVPARHADSVPSGTVALVVPEPYRAVALVAAKLYPQAMRPASVWSGTGIAQNAAVHPEARLAADVTVDPGAVIGPRATIGAGTVIGPGVVIGPDVVVGRDCAIGAHASVICAILGDRVILHSGVRIGQDGFGFAMGPGGHLKMPQIGRVVLGHDVEIGANSAVDRGSNRDTIVGDGTKIDNLVQIGHNVSIGRHCVIVAQTGISGSTTLGDYVVTGGQVGLAGHLTIGAGAQIGAKSGVMTDIPAGERWFGIPAQRAREEFKRHAMMRRLSRNEGKPPGAGG